MKVWRMIGLPGFQCGLGDLCWADDFSCWDGKCSGDMLIVDGFYIPVLGLEFFQTALRSDHFLRFITVVFAQNMRHSRKRSNITWDPPIGKSGKSTSTPNRKGYTLED